MIVANNWYGCADAQAVGLNAQYVANAGSNLGSDANYRILYPLTTLQRQIDSAKPMGLGKSRPRNSCLVTHPAIQYPLSVQF